MPSKPVSRRVAIYCRGKAVRANLAAQGALRRVASPERREKRSQGVGIYDGRYGSAKTLRELETVPGPAIIVKLVQLRCLGACISAPMAEY
jgi:hypothetical protein